jgi:transcriptional regulator with XRE-family HTH domain
MTKAHPVRPHLLAWRQRMGKTLTWLANEIGTSHSTVQRQEKGKLGVDDATFAAIAKAYGITVAELSADPADSEKAREMARLLEMVKQLDARGVRTLADLSEQLGGKRA